MTAFPWMALPGTAAPGTAAVGTASTVPTSTATPSLAAEPALGTGLNGITDAVGKPSASGGVSKRTEGLISAKALAAEETTAEAAAAVVAVEASALQAVVVVKHGRNSDPSIPALSKDAARLRARGTAARSAVAAERNIGSFAAGVTRGVNQARHENSSSSFPSLGDACRRAGFAGAAAPVAAAGAAGGAESAVSSSNISLVFPPWAKGARARGSPLRVSQ